MHHTHCSLHTRPHTAPTSPAAEQDSSAHHTTAAAPVQWPHRGDSAALALRPVAGLSTQHTQQALHSVLHAPKSAPQHEQQLDMARPLSSSGPS
jgi:hypothetical protein